MFAELPGPGGAHPHNLRTALARQRSDRPHSATAHRVAPLLSQLCGRERAGVRTPKLIGLSYLLPLTSTRVLLEIRLGPGQARRPLPEPA